MEVFLVRHGQTNDNVAKRHQPNNSILTELGEEQAQRVAQSLSSYSPTHLVTSHLVRAVQTAEVIGQTCGLTPEVSRLFAELERPSKLIGHSHFSVESLWYYAHWYGGFSIERFSDGETYRALRERAQAAREFLERSPEQSRVVVVSHTIFINFFLAHMYQPHTLTPPQLLRVLDRSFRLRNTGMVKLVYGSLRGEEERWQIVDRTLETS